MEKSSKSYDIYILMCVQKSAQTLHRICSCFRLTHIKCDLWFHILPFIYYCIVHMYRIPHNICQETYRIFMKWLCSSEYYITCFFDIAPLSCRHCFSGGSIHNFPPSVNIVSRIYCQHIRIQMIHQMNLQFIRCSCMERCHDIHLLDFLRICLCPDIILTGCIISCIYLGTSFF